MCDDEERERVARTKHCTDCMRTVNSLGKDPIIATAYKGNVSRGKWIAYSCLYTS